MTPLRAALIYTVLPDAQTARDIAKILLEERLVACANILGPIESVFLWNGKLDTSEEVGVLFKTASDQIEPAVTRMHALHPYETPAIVASACDAAHDATLQWLLEQTRGKSSS